MADPHLPEPPAHLALGVDVGGTKIEVSLVDVNGRVVRTQRQATDAVRGPAHVIGEVVALVDESLHRADAAVDAVGVAVAGQVDAHGTVRGAPNLEWTDVPLRDELERRLARPVVVLNDVRAAAWAEWYHGAGRGMRDVVVLFLGTGIGGAAVTDGEMLDGATNTHGEFGHTTLVAGGRQCHCRNRGCLEAYCAGWSIAERAQEAARADPAGGAALVRLAGGVDQITSGTVAAARTLGDPLALSLVRETGELLGAAVVSLVNALNPQRIILGGGVMDGFPELLELAEAVARARALPAPLEVMELVPAALGNHAPAVGAAAAARRTRALRPAREPVRGAPGPWPAP
jgi:glucokinase